MALALGAVTMLGACKKSDNATAGATTAAESTATAGGAAGTSTGASTAGATTGAVPNQATSNPASTEKMTDAEIFSMLKSANQGEIDAGKLAESKATNPAVKAFARDMVTDHTTLLNQGNALAKKLNVTPQPAATDSIAAMNKQVAQTLQQEPKGTKFDSAYVNNQVLGHQNTLDLVKRAQDQAQNAELKTLLQNAQPVIQRHLDRIKDIQGKLK
jgi:putative membrane protein